MWIHHKNKKKTFSREEMLYKTFIFKISITFYDLY